jgi:hypothetical protein
MAQLVIENIPLESVSHYEKFSAKEREMLNQRIAHLITQHSKKTLPTLKQMLQELAEINKREPQQLTITERTDRYNPFNGQYY